MELTLIPAYGRDYPTIEAMIKDWEGGKDFKIIGGPFTSIRDYKKFPGTHFKIRFNKLREFVLFTIGTGQYKDLL